MEAAHWLREARRRTPEAPGLRPPDGREVGESGGQRG